MSFEDAAAVAEAFVTAHDAIVTQADLQERRDVAGPAVGSGVGTAAVQLATAHSARSSIGTARTADKLERATRARPRSRRRRRERQVRRCRASALGRCRRELELVGGAYVAEDLRCVQTLGRIVLVGLMAGAKTELDLGLVLRKRVRILGTVLRARPLEEKIAAMRAFEAQVVPLLARGSCKPIVDA